MGIHCPLFMMSLPRYFAFPPIRWRRGTGLRCGPEKLVRPPSTMFTCCRLMAPPRARSGTHSTVPAEARIAPPVVTRTCPCGTADAPATRSGPVAPENSVGVAGGGNSASEYHDVTIRHNQLL